MKKKIKDIIINTIVFIYALPTLIIFFFAWLISLIQTIPIEFINWISNKRNRNLKYWKNFFVRDCISSFKYLYRLIL
jgi:uncharacterized protein HemY